MKHLKAQNKFEDYKTVTMEMKYLVPASVYKNVPDREKLFDSIQKGEFNDKKIHGRDRSGR